MYFFGFGAGENERETYHGRIAVQGHSGLSPLKGEMSHSDRGVLLRAATLPTSPFWGGFAKGTCSNLSPLKREMSRSDRGVLLRAATLPTSPFRGGFAKGTCSNLSPLKGEMSRSDRGVDPSEQLRCPPPLSGEALQKGQCYSVTEGCKKA